MTGLDRRPNNDSELIRQLQQRVHALEERSTSRFGSKVITQDPVTKVLYSVDDDGSSHNLTPDPAAREDVVAGIMPGVFIAVRVDEGGVTANSDGSAFEADWYDEVRWTSDRLEFDSPTNTITAQSTALMLIGVHQGVTRGQLGARQFRAQLNVARLDAEDFSLYAESPNAYYTSAEPLVFGGWFLLPVTPGDRFSPGYWCSSSPLGALIGDPAGTLTRLEVARVIDL